MKRRTHRRMLFFAQVSLVGGLGLAALWNVGSVLLKELPDPGWFGIVLAVPGLLLWLAALGAPRLVAMGIPTYGETYRLVYDAPHGWGDDQARLALMALVNSAGLGITWARDGFQGPDPQQGTSSLMATGCWLSVPEGWGDVLGRLVKDVFPGGQVELDQAPMPDDGVVVLRWRDRPARPGSAVRAGASRGDQLPSPDELCRLEGVEGVYYRWRDPQTATVALWGVGAKDMARGFARQGDLLSESGDALRRPPYVGENPWPDLPPFPPSQANPGLAAVSRLERLAPALRVAGPALVVGRDTEGVPAGFALPGLEWVRPLWIVGHAAEEVAVNLATQAMRAGIATCFLDAKGTAVSTLARQMMRDVAAGRVLVCDVERPAQTRFRVNPLWLPASPETWSRILPAWLNWLRELGVTPGGLGQAAYRHTQIAVVISTLVAAGQGVALDLPGLRSALDLVDFLPVVDAETLPYDPRRLLREETWEWWIAEGRNTQSFDVHLRLGHLRDRLDALLSLPEYSVLWQAPYLDLLTALGNGVSGLLWRLPDPRRRLHAYVTSQLLALMTLLVAWPAERPLLIFLHELNAGDWVNHLVKFAAARLVFVARQATSLPDRPHPQAVLVSRLDKEDAALLQSQFFSGVRPGDLRRLPEARLLFSQNGAFGTVDL
jgi:hypothetical protein